MSRKSQVLEYIEISAWQFHSLICWSVCLVFIYVPHRQRGGRLTPWAWKEEHNERERERERERKRERGRRDRGGASSWKTWSGEMILILIMVWMRERHFYT